jgi:NAD(P)-dependent dehydrogenase (short-subunit alcohol dehydrogenase family)
MSHARNRSSVLEGKVCLVTGGAQGLGWALCQALADEGAQVHACDIAMDAIERARAEVARLGVQEKIHFARCDVANADSVTCWIREVRRLHDRIDVLVNNAAFIRWADFGDMTVEDELRTMRVGFEGMLLCTRAVLPEMLRAGSGHIVNIGSSVGKLFVGYSSAAYAAMKAALDGYTQTLQSELRGAPVALTLVRPAAIGGTGFFREHVSSQRLPRLTDVMGVLTPTRVAAQIVGALRERKAIVNVPGWLRAFYVLFELVPNFVRWLIRLGGHSRADLGNVQWHHDWRTHARPGGMANPAAKGHCQEK